MSASPSDEKSSIIKELQQASSLQSAQRFMTNLRNVCFERCITKPGTSLSRGEEGCTTSCMEKYLDAWNAVQEQYITRMQREAEGAGKGGGWP